MSPFVFGFNSFNESDGFTFGMGVSLDASSFLDGGNGFLWDDNGFPATKGYILGAEGLITFWEIRVTIIAVLDNDAASEGGSVGNFWHNGYWQMANKG